MHYVKDKYATGISTGKMAALALVLVVLVSIGTAAVSAGNTAATSTPASNARSAIPSSAKGATFYASDEQTGAVAATAATPGDAGVTPKLIKSTSAPSMVNLSDLTPAGNGATPAASAGATAATTLQLATGQRATLTPFWIRQYGGTENYAIRRVITLSNGNIVAVGTRDDNAWFLKTDTNGNVLVNRYFSTSFGVNGFNDVKQLPNGNFICAGYKGEDGGMRLYAVLLDPNGNTLWSKTYGGGAVISEVYGYAVVLTPDGGFLFVGSCEQNYYDFQAFALKTNATGAVKWARMYGGPSDDFGSDAALATGGGYIIAGTANSWGPECVWLIKTDSNGNVFRSGTWENLYQMSNAQKQAASRVVATSNGYAIAGTWYDPITTATRTDVLSIKVDLNGNYKSWSLYYGGGDGNNWSHDGSDIRTTAQGGYMLAGTWDVDHKPSLNRNYDLFAVVEDSAGHALYGPTLFGTSSTQEYGNSCAQGSGGFVWAGATINQYSSTPLFYGYLVKAW